MTKPDIEIIATGLHFPEGPVELPDGSIAVVEIGRGRIVRIREGGRQEPLTVTNGGPNGMALGPDGALYVCNNGGFSWAEEGGWLRPVGLAPDYSGGKIQRVDVSTGEVTTLYDQCDGRTLSGPNDIVFDNQGGFYFTDTGRVREFQRDHGAVGGELVIGLGGFQRIDSLKVAASGNICVSTLVTGCITVVSPRGELLDQVWMPEIYPTNLGFVGKTCKMLSSPFR